MATVLGHHWLSLGLRQHLADELAHTDDELARWAALLIAVHDVGKASAPSPPKPHRSSNPMVCPAQHPPPTAQHKLKS